MEKRNPKDLTPLSLLLQHQELSSQEMEIQRERSALRNGDELTKQAAASALLSSLTPTPEIGRAHV